MHIQRASLALAAALVLGAVLVFADYWETIPPGSVTSHVPSKFTVNGKTFPITYTATTNAQRERGLMNTTITDTTIMLFVFPQPGEYSFWMFNTNTSLDMIWVNSTGSAGRVAYLITSAPPCYVASSCAKYAPSFPANYVLEAKAGFAESNGIGVGTAIQFG
jgi:uncharacterized membrane protein (UPF0127 family)